MQISHNESNEFIGISRKTTLVIAYIEGTL